MTVAHTTLFKRSYQKLTKSEQRRIDGTIRKLMQKPHSPFLKGISVHKLAGVKGTPAKLGMPHPDVWEMHASRSLIVTFQYGRNEIVFRNCGQHATVLRTP